ncbi:MAG: hypothetical protein ACRDQJ_19210 [Pseudonocardiaceae bacterium]
MKGIRPLGRDCHRPSSYAASLEDEGVTGRLVHDQERRRHIEPTDEELDRLQELLYVRTLYLTCFGYRRAINAGATFREWGFITPPDYYDATAAAARAAFRT